MLGQGLPVLGSTVKGVKAGYLAVTGQTFRDEERRVARMTAAIPCA
jgi:hypothetical protein